MGKTSERLKDYQTQMSIYAEQHKMILASDVLDMIEQLQDDLKDDVEKVVTQVNKKLDKLLYICDLEDVDKVYNFYDDVEDYIRKGGVE